jgi:DNA invertase Pin-like site-specific DNA recombinase
MGQTQHCCHQGQSEATPVRESLMLTGDNSPLATLLLNMMGSFAEFELAWSLERQREGIEVAKKASLKTASAC